MTEKQIIAANVANGWKLASDPPQKYDIRNYPLIVMDDTEKRFVEAFGWWTGDQWGIFGLHNNPLTTTLTGVILWYPVPAPVL